MHGAPRISRILLDETGRALRVDGLETVSPGIAPLDFGIAACGAWGAAVGGAPNGAGLAAFARGYCAEAGPALAEAERALLAEGMRRAALEEGMRDLAAWLRGGSDSTRGEKALPAAFARYLLLERHWEEIASLLEAACRTNSKII